ncbi:MAG TPA: hypothetical protein VLR49_04705, partial [Ferruginibacter sp.]|nr:hypothetical protein [Ferruginibacter sp.]
MNTQNITLFTAISEAETKKLTTIVNETLVCGNPEKKAFTAADLWNIQRQKRSIVQRRYFA